MESSLKAVNKRSAYKLSFRRLPGLFRRPGNFFRRLQWKLTLAYTVCSVITILILGAIALAILWYLNFQSNFLPNVIAETLLKSTPALSPYLETSPPDKEGLQDWLGQVIQANNLVIYIPKENAQDENDLVPAQFGQVISVVIVDETGQALAAAPTGTVQLETNFQPQLSPELLPGFEAALRGETEPEQISMRDPEGYMVATVPVLGQDNALLGAIFVKLTFPVEASEFLQNTLKRLVLPFSLIMLAVGLIIAALFGYIVAQGFTRRLRLLGEAADAWSEGNFDTLVQDKLSDELGLLTRHLNHMVIQLQNLLQTRQELAGLEERNRLARDLHDSVKQQVFATAMQVGAAKALIDQQPETAKAHLIEAETLVRQAQQELNTLILELRPAALEGRGLTSALREYINDWSRQTAIASEVRISGERSLPLTTEQTLFRIAQEALANIARHSAADRVELYLAWEQNQVRLVIVDNGRGFNRSKLNKRGVGLQSMGERVEVLGGQLKIESEPGAGTRVTAQIGISE